MLGAITADDGGPSLPYGRAMAVADPLHVVVAGGGPAALEAVMALRDLAGDQVRLTLVAPEPEFEVKAFRVAEPFAVDRVPRRTMQAFADRFGVELQQASLARVDPDRRAVELANGDTIAYDSLVLAVGARTRPAYRHATTVGAGPRGDELWVMLREIVGGLVRSVAFVVPPQTTWPLPLYELALMTAREARRNAVSDLRLEVISPEGTPLGVFGPRASDAVAALLAQADVAFAGGLHAEVGEPGTIRLGRGGVRHVDRVVSLPALAGPRMPGVPADAHGFIPVDEHGRVEGVDGVYAAGDATDFPVKQGGLACQQADAVAEHIAAHVITGLEPHPFRPVLRGKLLTGRGAAYLNKARDGDDGVGRAAEVQLWAPPTKVSGRYLSRWLVPPDAPDAGDVQPHQEDGIEVEVPLQR
jgi:sulfide:quinone oxidoreductase